MSTRYLCTYWLPFSLFCWGIFEFHTVAVNPSRWEATSTAMYCVLYSVNTPDRWPTHYSLSVRVGALATCSISGIFTSRSDERIATCDKQTIRPRAEGSACLLLGGFFCAKSHPSHEKRSPPKKQDKGSISNTSHLRAKSHPSHEKRSPPKMQGKGSVSNISHLHAKSLPSHEKRSPQKMQDEGSISNISHLRAKSHPSHEKCSPQKMQGKGSVSNTSHLHAKSHPSHEKRSSSKIQNRECLSIGRVWRDVEGACMKE